jgi:hypothetical protein
MLDFEFWVAYALRDYGVTGWRSEFWILDFGWWILDGGWWMVDCGRQKRVMDFEF